MGPRRALALILMVAGCGRAPAPAPTDPPPLLVLGIDGATRTIMDPLMEAGRLPNFKRLADRGVYTALATREPTISPIIWTSMATGKVPEKHGIHGFTAPIPDSEKLTRLRVPEAARELRLSFTGIAPEGLSQQTGRVMVGDKVKGQLELTAQPRTQELTLGLDGPTSEIAIAWEHSVRKGRSPFYTTAFGKATLAADGGPPRELSSVSDAIEGLYPRAVERDGVSYVEFGGPQRIVTVSSNMRRVKAVWTILSEAKRKVMVAGYWVTWPAEEVNGVMLSSYTSARYGRSKKGTYLKDFPRQTHPAALADELGPVLAGAIDKAKSHAEKVAARFHVTLRPIAQEDLAPENRFITGEAGTIKRFNPEDGAEQIIWIRSADTFYTDATVRLWPRERPALAIVYTGEVDVVSHDWHGLEKDLTQGVIAQAYERADANLGLLLGALGADADRANVMVVSDHGFAWDSRGVFEHQFTHPPGVLLMAGPSIQKDAVAVDPGVLDVGPTLLALTGLPAARDMDGRVLQEILTFPAPEPIPTYETGPPRAAELPIASPVDDKVKEQLRALGYIE